MKGGAAERWESLFCGDNGRGGCCPCFVRIHGKKDEFDGVCRLEPQEHFMLDDQWCAIGRDRMLQEWEEENTENRT